MHPRARSADTHRNHENKRPVVVWSTTLLIAWSALTFGAVYPWAYWPLLCGSVLIGLASVFTYGIRASYPVAIGLLLVGAAVALQLIPLPNSVIRHISPATDQFLNQYLVTFSHDPAAHPLSLNPSATLLGLTFLGCLGMLAVGLAGAMTPGSIRRLATNLGALTLVLALIG